MTEAEKERAAVVAIEDLPDAGSIHTRPLFWHSEKPWKPDLERCRCSVPDHGMSVGFHQCSNKVKVWREVNHKGKREVFGYCGVHDPIKVAEREAKRQAKWQAEWDAKQAESDAKAAAKRLGEDAVDALRQIASGHNDPRALAIETLGHHLSTNTDGDD